MTRTITTLSSRENTRRAKKKARTGPVVITDRGRPTHVLMTIDDYQALTGGPMMLAAALAQPESADIEFEPPRLRGPLSRRVDFA